jgi:hypothetical protein
MKRFFAGSLMCFTLAATAQVFARDVQVDVANLSTGNYFTPLLIAAHPASHHLFDVGHAASPQLQAMAEGGDISGLIKDIVSAEGEYVANPAAGLLAPGQTTSVVLDIRGKNKNTTHLSIVAMILPTNDGFIGLNAVEIPRKEGTYTYYLSSYDAGTEANDEIINGGGAPGVPGIPADPAGHSGINGTGSAGEDISSTVHAHPGILGDFDPVGGPSDLNANVHRWSNPIATVVITVTKN